ncbi:MAG: hypothetical protein ACOC2Y_03325 [Spirochaetota bacterium]
MTESHDNEHRAPSRRRSYLLSVLSCFAHRWRLVFFLTVFALLATALVMLVTQRIAPDSRFNPFPDVYASEAQILLDDPNVSASLAERLLLGNSLLDRIVDEFELMEEYADGRLARAAARAAIRDGLESAFERESGILTITYSHEDPVFATDVLGRAIDLLEARFIGLTRTDARARTEAIELQLRLLEDDVRQARDELTAFQEQYGVIDPADQGRQTIDLINEFRRSKFELELEREQIADIVEDREHPQILRINRSIRRIEQLIAELETGYRRYSPVTIPLRELGPITVRFEDLRRDVRLKEEILSAFQEELIRARIETQDTSRWFQIVEAPEVPTAPIRPRRGRVTLLVTALVFLLSLVLASILEYFARAELDQSESRKPADIKDQFRRRKSE